MRNLTRMCLAVGPLAMLAACDQSHSTISAPSLASAAKAPDHPTPSAPMLVASGLNNPRGIAFDNNGDLYVAEAGTTAGNNSTEGTCQQDPMISHSGTTGRISKIVNGAPVPVIQGLPSSHHIAANDVTVFGINDIAFVGPKLYGLLNAGCGHGVPGIPASVIAVDGGQYQRVADLSAFRAANPPVRLGRDVEPDGDWYSMIAVGGVLFAVDANGGELVSIKPGSGKIDRVIDISATQGHVVPTAVTEFEGDFYIGNLETFPAVAGGAKVWRTRRNADQGLDVVATNLTAILGVATDKAGRGYALESFHCVASASPPFPPHPPCVPGPWAAGTGDVVRQNLDGSTETIVTGLTFPSSIRFGPDGALYISNKSYGLPAGSGEILKVTFQN